MWTLTIDNRLRWVGSDEHTAAALWVVYCAEVRRADGVIQYWENGLEKKLLIAHA